MTTKTPPSPQFKVPIQQLPYMGPRKQDYSPPPEPKSRENKVFYPEKDDFLISKKKGGKVSSASSRADGCCVKGKTRGKMV